MSNALCARAPARFPTPTPILFFSGNRGRILEVILTKTQYQSLNPAAVNWWNSLTAATQPTDTATFPPLVPSESKASEGGGRERTPGGAGAILGHHQASTDPGRVTCGESAPSPGLSALHADRTPAPRGSRSPLGLRGQSSAPGSLPCLRGPSALNWLQPAAATERGSRWREGPSRGGGESGQAQKSGDRKVLPNTVGLLRLLLNGSGPGGGGGSDIPGERSRRRRLLLHSLLASLPRRAHRAPRPFSHLPPPSPTHTRPETLSPTAPAGG
ncbi:collagen alpha-2(V) chain-like [Mustela lutreola]|uniref:collagen alpha-2(V) chain-like n=1 Tax=Mustela lutreola TaxID=9666 RepID=UPI002797999B|nr:collagen alpha-2(V) chain-like [Mustela lutreola]